ncbi:unnamed protein product [Larinioides sclopetarius]|uniref:Uncharacterized protein n=1 Tax=Larinioides sclopetarius TaxID=280406 RepID=A0AAV2BK90_9ARAC
MGMNVLKKTLMNVRLSKILCYHDTFISHEDKVPGPICG